MKAKSTIEYKDLKRAIKNHPLQLRMSVNKFLVRASASYRRAINQTTWTMGSSGGGVPKLSQNLRMAHEYTIRPFSLVVSVNENRADYAKYVYFGTRNMKARPWLLSVKNKQMSDIKNYQNKLLKEITNALGK